jgi:hypothetical protein
MGRGGGGSGGGRGRRGWALRRWRRRGSGRGRYRLLRRDESEVSEGRRERRREKRDEREEEGIGLSGEDRPVFLGARGVDRLRLRYGRVRVVLVRGLKRSCEREEEVDELREGSSRARRGG